jgi:hypothetical protein
MFKIYFKNKGCTRKLSMTNRLNCEPHELTREFWSAQEGQLVCFIDPVHEDKKYWRANMQILDSTKVRYQKYRYVQDAPPKETCYWSQLAYLELNKFGGIFTQRTQCPLHDMLDSPEVHKTWEHLCAIPHIFRAAINNFSEWFPNTNNVKQ